MVGANQEGVCTRTSGRMCTNVEQTAENRAVDLQAVQSGQPPAGIRNWRRRNCVPEGGEVDSAANNSQPVHDKL